MINRFEPQFDFIGVEQEEQSVKRPPAYEIIKTLTPFALVVAGIYTKSHGILYTLAGVAVIGIYYDHVKHWVVSYRINSHNRRVAKRNIKRLKVLSEDLGHYFDLSWNRTDTLHGIVNSIGQRDMLLPQKFGLPQVNIFHVHWHFLNERIQNERFNAKQFYAAAKELQSLISSYSAQAVHPAYGALAYEKSLTPNERSYLSAFQMRWVAFVNDYIKFVKELNKDFNNFEQLPIGVSLPLPLP
jgi:hypothetical protein